MLKNIIITVIIIIIAVELIEHIIFPIVWSIFKGSKRSIYGVAGMIGKVVEIRRWNKTEGQVFINGYYGALCARCPCKLVVKRWFRVLKDLH